ncbi:MAG: bifunctional glycosyltransferase family 2/GtrA family protein [Lachnospiraceae bacterium]|nr:bifunctional glycosyltransferase family 2/GtrA family protein [Butyrivibrio sp.]MCM1343597.1 bifunctional glycosyltransferase family 2/GtrA family protein [Muribaculaceae bacterium]MCM1411234.1 bifunctional glycosyltransferase family 2/GtrA family protein [Lachnospiraceae bacterium]
MNSISLSDIAIVIPALNPDDKLISYIEGLQKSGFEKIVVINDGSTMHTHIFQELEKKKVCVLTHAVNQGKGRGLKTGINYLLNTYSSSELAGMVTADADGQHSVEDTLKVAERLKDGTGLVLGTRDFSQQIVPFKSRSGNRITTAVFSFFYGKKISDTQTGLRGIPYDFMKDCLTYAGERYEYETAMLIGAVSGGLEITEVPIRTIYYENNRNTHFSATRDSARIYKVLMEKGLRYSCASLLSMLADLSVFTLLTAALPERFPVAANIFIGTCTARILSSLMNYFLNRNRVFRSSESIGRTMPRYCLLCVSQMLVSWFCVLQIHNLTGIHSSVVKALVDTALFFGSYYIQRRWVFKQRRGN